MRPVTRVRPVTLVEVWIIQALTLTAMWFMIKHLQHHAVMMPVAPIVCHAVTEDSIPVDCSYDHGGWRRK